MNTAPERAAAVAHQLGSLRSDDPAAHDAIAAARWTQQVLDLFVVPALADAEHDIAHPHHRV